MIGYRVVCLSVVYKRLEFKKYINDIHFFSFNSLVFYVSVMSNRD